jgi:hypothetical protein
MKKRADALGVEIEDLFSEEAKAPKEGSPPPIETSEERHVVELLGTMGAVGSVEGKLTVEVPLTLLWHTEAALEAVENATELEPEKQDQVREVRHQVHEALERGLIA